MTFKINIECETAAEAIAELIHAAAFYKANPAIVAAPEAEAPVRAKRTPKADVKELAPAVGPTPDASTAATPSETKAPPAPLASTATDAAGGASTNASSTDAPWDEPAPVVTISDVRAFLTPFLANPDTAPQVTGLIRDIGGAARLSELSVPNLAKLLAAAKELFA